MLIWLADNWAVTLQCAGVIGGLGCTGKALRVDMKARQVANWFALTTFSVEPCILRYFVAMISNRKRSRCEGQNEPGMQLDKPTLSWRPSQLCRKTSGNHPFKSIAARCFPLFRRQYLTPPIQRGRLESLQQRIQKLKAGNGSFALLALDHGLTYGVGQTVEPAKVKSLLQTFRGRIGGVVLTFGLAKYLKLNGENTPLIVQCFGGPLQAEKVQVASIEQALRLRATAVSVQLSICESKPPDSSQTREIAGFVSVSYQHGLPVLFMISGHDPSNLLFVANVIRIAQEMGADLIKVRAVPKETAPTEELEALATTVNQAPPVLLAGGTMGTALIAEAETAARRLSFSGYCVGRNIFQAPDPLSVVSALNTIWDKTKNH